MYYVKRGALHEIQASHCQISVTPLILVGGFLLIISIGTILLMLPISNRSGEHLAFIDALFTATSAACVTGLVVVDVGTTFNLLGQIVIMVLMQLGGLGFMTIATLFALVLGKRISLKDRLLLKEAINADSMEGIVRIIRKVLIFSFTIEGGCCDSGFALGSRNASGTSSLLWNISLGFPV